ncbi:hypothetical protein KFE25_005783 [Diacronema lutheri]|uniref:Thioredoxin domain-containing protein n=1 Tax=Diacronema lutheri TaxID=2081491 RepID=A0A8J5X7G1_DIALT|nr:hypothetical protein KFE25_005783 [Diacronema lutheri]
MVSVLPALVVVSAGWARPAALRAAGSPTARLTGARSTCLDPRQLAPCHRRASLAADGSDGVADALVRARAALSALRVPELRQRLEERDASWADLFEKRELVDRLAALVVDGDAPAAPAAAPAAGTDMLVRARAEVGGLRVAELRQRLADRGIGWADLFEKEELVERLAGAIASELRFCARSVVPLGTAANLGEEEARRELADGSTPLLLDVYAKWCGPCQVMAPALAQVAAELRGRVRVVKVDSDAATALASELRVQALPTLIAFRRGAPVHRAEGALSAQAIRRICDEHLLSPETRNT